MPNQHLGIHIRTDGIDVVKLSRRLKNVEVGGQWRVAFENGAYSPEHLESALATIADAEAITGCECAVSLPASWSYLRQITLPFRDKKKIEQVLSFEVEPLLPVPADGLIVDYQSTYDGTGSNLMTAAMDRSRLASVIAALGAHKLNPGLVTLGGSASLSMLQQSLKPEDDGVFVFMTAAHTVIFFFSGKQLAMVRCLETGELSSPPQQAAADIRRAILSLRDSRTGATFTPGRLFLSSSSDWPSRLPEPLSDLLGIPAERFHPGRLAAPLSMTGTDAAALEDLLPLTEAFSLALCSIKGFQGLNFRKGPFAVGRFWQEYRKSLVAPAVIGLLIVLTAGYRSMATIHEYQSRLDGIRQQITETFKTALPEVKHIANPAHQLRTKLAEIKQEAPEFVQAHQTRRVLDMLRAISERIPEGMDVVLNQVVFGPDAIQLSGDTDTFNAVNVIQQNLQQEPAFVSVSISSANQQKSGNRVNFKIRVQL